LNDIQVGVVESELNVLKHVWRRAVVETGMLLLLVLLLLRYQRLLSRRRCLACRLQSHQQPHWRHIATHTTPTKFLIVAPTHVWQPLLTGT